MPLQVSIETSVDIVVETCFKCGVVFGMNRTRYLHAKNHGSEFFCTNGHGQVYREPEVARLARELANSDRKLANEREQREKAERSVIAQKAQVTRLKNKVARGECPCCGKTFADLLQHMKEQHPDFENEEGGAKE